MYGNTITMFDALTITLFSMGLVFVALIVISYFIDFIAKVVNRSKKATVPTQVIESTKDMIETVDDTEEMIAVVSAAVAAASGKSLQDFVIRNIQPVENHESAWSQTGRAEAMR